MKKVCLVCMKEERDAVLEALQRSELMMLTSSEEGVQSEGDSALFERRLDTLLKELQKHKKKRSLFDDLPEVNISDFEKMDGDLVVDAKKVEEKLLLSDRLAREKGEAERSLEEILVYKDFPHDFSVLGESEYTLTLIGRVPSRFLEEFEALDLPKEVISKSEKDALVLITFLKEEKEGALTALGAVGFEALTPPLKSGKAEDEIGRLEALILQKREEIREVSSEIKELAKKTEDFELLFEQYRARADREEVRLSETLETVIFEGFVRADSVDTLYEKIKEVTNVFTLDSRDPEEDEEVPTSLDNGRTVAQFEGITDMFNSPSYKGYDPNAVMAPWYALIFGMMMGDAGYGALMALFIILGKIFIKPKGGTLKLMNVMLYSSIPTIFFGVLFGSYFGEELLPAVVGFTAMDDPIKMLIITLVIGVLHILTGMIVKIYLDVKDGRILDAIFDEVSWILIILGIAILFIPSLSTVGTILAVVGATVVLFTAGRKKKGVVGKIVGGLGGLYGITGYFSDILSYSRILALSLATGVVGMVMNLLAGMVQGSVIGFIISLVIYIVGHIFNLALGLLSAYVHSCRLQYIEFYSKFYEGGGVLFRPFRIRTNYINLKK